MILSNSKAVSVLTRLPGPPCGQSSLFLFNLDQKHLIRFGKEEAKDKRSRSVSLRLKDSYTFY